MKAREWIMLSITCGLLVVAINQFFPTPLSNRNYLNPTLIGKQIIFPENDSYGKTIQAGELNLIIMPPCTSCAIKNVNPAAIRKNVRGDIVWIFPSTKKDIDLYKMVVQNNDYIFHLPLPNTSLDRLTYEHPKILLVNAKGVIINEQRL